VVGQRRPGRRCRGCRNSEGLRLWRYAPRPMIQGAGCRRLRNALVYWSLHAETRALPGSPPPLAPGLNLAVASFGFIRPGGFYVTRAYCPLPFRRPIWLQRRAASSFLAGFPGSRAKSLTYYAQIRRRGAMVSMTLAWFLILDDGSAPVHGVNRPGGPPNFHATPHLPVSLFSATHRHPAVPKNTLSP